MQPPHGCPFCTLMLAPPFIRDQLRRVFAVVRNLGDADTVPGLGLRRAGDA
jgi:hypothetical protein